MTAGKEKGARCEVAGGYVEASFLFLSRLSRTLRLKIAQCRSYL